MKLTEWLSFRQTCLDELLRHDGLGSSLGQKGCWSCQKDSKACWKCLDCNDGGLMRCQDCIISMHTCHAFHRIEVWHSLLYLIQLVCSYCLLLRNGMVAFSRNHLFATLAFAFSLDMEEGTALLQHLDRPHSLL